MNSHPLGSKENPHPITPSVKDRVKGHYYIYKNEVRLWNGDKFRSKEQIKKKNEYNKKYRENNKEKIKKQHKEWCEKNKEKIKKQREEWCEKNKDYEKDRYKNDPIYRIKKNMRNRVLSAMKAQGASKNKRTMEYVNCCVELLYNHIESQFGDSGMNWDNMGREDGECGRGWEVDHRRPCDSFDLNDEEQKYMCFHWTNLQPMWGQENNEKGNKYDPETYPYKWIDREIGWVGIPSYLMKKKILEKRFKYKIFF